MYSDCVSGRNKTTDNRRFSGLDHSYACTDTNTVRSNLRSDGTTRTIYHYHSGKRLLTLLKIISENPKNRRLLLKETPLLLLPWFLSQVVSRFDLQRQLLSWKMSLLP